MSNPLKTVATSALFAVGLASATAVYAEQNPSRDGSDAYIGTGMRHGGMMGMQGGMMGQTGGMMDGCNSMMQGRSQTPNSQFHKPSEP